MKKKVAIFTMPFRFGYGGFMQAYALQTVLERMGHQVEVVQLRQGYYEPPHGLRALVVYLKRALFKWFKLSNTPIFAEKQYNAEWPILTEQVHQFIRDKIHLKEVNSFNELKEGEYDVLVVGSDQVWRPAYCDVKSYYLQFADKWKIKRIAYAASFGTSDKEYTEDLLAICKPMAKKFDSISVREDSAVSLCNDYFGIDAQHVLDPTLLLNYKDYEKIVSGGHTLKSSGNLFSYILDEQTWKMEIVRDVATELHLSPFSIRVCGDNHNLSIEERIQPSVEQWLRAFMDAEFVVTDSFHGCVFAILFHKPFIVLSNCERGNARIDSIMRMLSLGNRIAVGEEDINKIIYSRIDWDYLDDILKMLRQKSLAFLNNSLC